MSTDILQDWNLIRAFLAVATTGSLSAAARQIHLSQPTLSRQISQLESESGLNLFKRTSQGLELTEQGKNLVESASVAQSSMESFQRQLQGHSESLTGEVRISANEIVGVHLLPSALKAFQDKFPEIQVEVVVSNGASSLSKRDADIALRMFRPTQPDLVAKRLPNMPLGFFAHRSYLDKHGLPEVPTDLYRHRIIGYDQDTSFIDGARALGFVMSPKHFCLRTDNLLVQIQWLMAGAGITGTHKGLFKHQHDIIEVLSEIKIPDLEFWLVCHSDVQFNRRIKLCMEFLAEWFKDNPYHGLTLN